MSSPPATTPIEAPVAATPRRHEVARATMTIEGHALSEVSLAGWSYGPLPGTAPVTVVVGGITASPFPLGDGRAEEAGGTAPWWPALFAPDLIDITRTTVVCPCWPGNGSTWRGFDDASPALSVLGLADLVAAWLDGIGCTSPVTFVGASLGGMVGVAFAARHPDRCRTLITISAGLRPDGWGTATRHLQRELVRDGLRNGDVTTGMVRARQLGMLTYRGRIELDTRFGSFTPGLERPPVADYLDLHGRRFAERFPVRTFLLPERGHRPRRPRRGCPHQARGARAGLGRHDCRRRSRRHAVPLGPAGRAAPRAAGGRRTVVAVDARLGLRPRRLPRRSGSARRSAARRPCLRRRHGASAAAAFRRRRHRASPRAAHRHGGLRHGRQRPARDDRSAAARGGGALRRALPRDPPGRARPGQAAIAPGRRHPAHGRCRSSS